MSSEETVAQTLVSWTEDFVSPSDTVNDYQFGIGQGDDTNYFGIILGALTILISVFGTSGNVLVIVSIWQNKKLKTLNNILLATLAINDGVFCGFVMPLLGYSLIIAGWDAGDTLCGMVAYLAKLLLAISFVTQGTISLNRYFTCVRFKQKWLSSIKMVVAMAMFNWLLPLALLVPMMVPGLGFVSIPPVATTAVCSVDAPSYAFTALYIVGNMITPIVTMTFSYTRIFYEVYSRRKRLVEQSQSAMSVAMANEIRLAKTMGLVYVSFVVCFVPSFITVLLGYEKNHWLYLATFSLVWASAAINPLIYGLTHAHFREAFTEILPFPRGCSGRSAGGGDGGGGEDSQVDTPAEPVSTVDP